MKKAIVILLTLAIAGYAVALDTEKNVDRVDFQMDSPSRIIISGELTDGSPTWHRWRGSSWTDIGLNCDLLMTYEYTSDPYYDMHCFNVTTDAPIEIEVTDAEFDTVIYVYCDPFDPNNSTENAVYGDDDDGVGLHSAITADNGVTLIPGNDYWLVICSYSAGNIGTYSMVTSDNIALCGIVANEGSSWSNVKGLFE